MPNGDITYHESVLHWIWKSMQVDLARLRTTDGQPLVIHKPGDHNHTDGPDFLNADISIGSMRWYGDVEIHWAEQDWNHHRHHTNPCYNRVILHVVYNFNDGQSPSVLRQDDTCIHTLPLKPYVNEPLRVFLNEINRPDTLPCEDHISYISSDAFERQLEKARQSYFEQKVNDLLCFYESALPPSRAWVQMLALGLCDGLGIAHNRLPMQNLGRQLLCNLHDFSSPASFADHAVAVSGIQSPSRSGVSGWKHKNCRPSNHPRVRIRQAAELLWHLGQIPFDQWLKNEHPQLWKLLSEQVETRPGLGKERSDIIFHTIWLPAFFILGNLFGSEHIRSSAYTTWMNHQAKLPQSLLKPFHSLDIPAEIYKDNLGSIFQLRSFCKPRKCESCEVFKNVISS